MIEKPKKHVMKIRPLRRLQQDDLSNSVVHFTGRVGKDNADVPLAIRKMDPGGRLASILITRQIQAFDIFHSSGEPVVCFTEATLAGMRTLAASGRYQPWGIEFSKDYVFQRDGGPAYYVRGDQWITFSQSDLTLRMKAFGTPYWPGADWEPPHDGLWTKSMVDYPNEWAHEREWRVPVAFDQDPRALTFEYRDIASIIAPSTTQGEKFKQSLPSEIRAAVAALPIVALGDPAKPTQHEVVIALTALSYESAVAVFQKIQAMLHAFPGDALVVLEMERSGGGVRRIPTSFKAEPNAGLKDAILKELGGAVARVDFR
jgi:hypothetical protein